MSTKRPSFGDLVDVSDEDGNVIAQGVVNMPALPVNSGYAVDTCYGPGYSLTEETFLSGIDADRIELVEECWGQKWQKRVLGY